MRAAAPPPPVLTVEDEIVVDFVLDSELVVDGPRRRERHRLDGAAPLDGAARVALPLGTRSLADDDGRARLVLPLGEPRVTRTPRAVCLERRRREIVVEGEPRRAWQLLRLVDGRRDVDAIVGAFAPDEREGARQLLALLSAAGGVDDSGRVVGAWLHAATKKGVLPAGDLRDEAVLRLLGDGDYRRPPGPARAIRRDVPGRLAPLFALTRQRRSVSRHADRPIARAELEAVLHTACGVTGELAWPGGAVPLRAYPSSGGLYAVEIYPVAFAVDELAAAVHHFAPVEGTLTELAPAERARFVAAAVPQQRDILGGVAAIVCLTARFSRHERKYGEGGYRMLAAEAGHLSQNLILAATALGLAARPCGGFFDDLVNQLLGVGGDEQFLLSVLLGRAAEAA